MKKNLPQDIFVVSWAAILTDEPQKSSSGIFSSLFSTKEKAYGAVMDDIATLAGDDLAAYDNDEDAIEALGTADAAELAKKMVKFDNGMYIECENSCGTKTQYCIAKFSLKYIK